MNPSKKGWLSEFLHYRKNLFLRSREFEKTKKGQHPDQSFYGIIQPTGIMYGYPIHVYDLERDYGWQQLDTVKVLLADSFINITELYTSSPVETLDSFYKLMYETMDSVNHFYNGVYPEISTALTNWLGQKKDVLLTTEKILEKRLDIIFKKSRNFWTDFFNHSQLFLDIYIFGQWSHTNPDRVLLEFFKDEKEELSYTAVKVMAAAAHANKRVESEEEKLFEHFIENSGLPAEKRRVAYEYFGHGLAIQDIPVEATDPWVIRKYFLELAILTIWSDKLVEGIEWDFLNNFNKSLGFSSEDFDSSMIAVEGFVLQNWHQLDSLQLNKDHRAISLDYVGRIARVTEKYKNRIKLEMTNDLELIEILKKGKISELSEEEKEILRVKFINILKTIPSFRVIALPKDFLSYEVLLKVVPKSVITEMAKGS
ncbi:hypothetical protein JMN32_07420 [Fulvivirga sp. 29W222]|uniref:Uncharacterized protein n=1 Tax=Fulvivirga marina TaxID=2494733 RepID=A0A937KAX5_9BACT|nr:hypothetical protein [Fulvivirga marina]MBL6446131.1 hypothetical protein [Fulvivirga marina]